MAWRLLRAILILPGTVVVLVPGTILLLTGGPRLGWSVPATILGGALLGLGLVLAVATVRLFVRRGEGTPAPWDPPQKLVVAGPYRYVRNPMISGVLFLLAGLALVCGSFGIGVWFALFLLMNSIYLPRWEEPGLERRFGDDYRRYREHVPRWIPRGTPWEP